MCRLAPGALLGRDVARGGGHSHHLLHNTHGSMGGGLEPTPDLVLALAAEALAALGGLELDSPRTLCGGVWPSACVFCLRGLLGGLPVYCLLFTMGWRGDSAGPRDPIDGSAVDAPAGGVSKILSVCLSVCLLKQT